MPVAEVAMVVMQEQRRSVVDHPDLADRLGLAGDLRPQPDAVEHQPRAVGDRRGAAVEARVEHRRRVLRVDDRDRQARPRRRPPPAACRSTRRRRSPARHHRLRAASSEHGSRGPISPVNTRRYILGDSYVSICNRNTAKVSTDSHIRPFLRSARQRYAVKNVTKVYRGKRSPTSMVGFPNNRQVWP